MDLPSVSSPDDLARRSAVAWHAALDVPAGGLGRLAEIGVWLAATQGKCPPRPPERVRVVVVAGDHGIAEAGVSVHPARSTHRQADALRAGTAPVAVVAQVGGATIRVVDVALDTRMPDEPKPDTQQPDAPTPDAESTAAAEPTDAEQPAAEPTGAEPTDAGRTDEQAEQQQPDARLPDEPAAEHATANATAAVPVDDTATATPTGTETDAGIDTEIDAPVEAATIPGPLDRYRVRDSSGRIDREDALSAEEVEKAIAVGRALADEEVDAGAELLIPASLGVGATTSAAVLMAALTGVEPVAVVGRGSGVDDEGWMRKVAAIRDALRRTRPHGRDAEAVLRVAGGADIAVLVGFCVQAALRRTPVVLDGTVVTVAAMIAEQLAPGAKAWWLVAQRSADPTAALAVERLGLDPLLELDIRLGDGTGAVAILPQLTMAAHLLAG